MENHLSIDFKSIEAVIFDFDGTLYDFKGLPRRIVLGNLKHIFKIKSERQARKFLKGKDFQDLESWENAFAEKLSEYGKITKEEGLTWYKDFYCPYMVTILKKYYKIRESVKQVLHILKKAQIPCVVFSDYPLVKERLEAIGGSIEDFSMFVSSESLGALKPAPRPFLEIAHNLNISPKKILVIGDREDTDGLGAKTCGMNFIQTESHKNKTKENIYSWDFLQSLFEKEFPSKI